MSNNAGARRNKHLILNQTKLERAQKVLRTETETIERALDTVLDERNRRARAARENFIKIAAGERFVIHDV